MELIDVDLWDILDKFKGVPPSNTIPKWMQITKDVQKI